MDNMSMIRSIRLFKK